MIDIAILEVKSTCSRAVLIAIFVDRFHQLLEPKWLLLCRQMADAEERDLVNQHLHPALLLQSGRRSDLAKIDSHASDQYCIIDSDNLSGLNSFVAVYP
jgi:hypothetical protein